MKAFVLLLCLPCFAFAQADAAASKAEAVRQYPALGEVGSDFNKRFVDLYNAALKSDRLAISSDDWPMKIAAQVAVELGVKPVARPGVVTIKEMRTDLPGFIGKAVMVEGTLDVSSYFGYSYRDSAMVLYSFEFSDGSGTGQVYALRTESEALRRQILDSKRPISGVFQIRIPGDSYHEVNEGVMADLLKVILTYPTPERHRR